MEQKGLEKAFWAMPTCSGTELLVDGPGSPTPSPKGATVECMHI